MPDNVFFNFKKILVQNGVEMHNPFEIRVLLFLFNQVLLTDLVKSQLLLQFPHHLTGIPKSQYIIL